MNTRLGRVTLLVKDYDEAYEFYEKNFLCKKLFDATGPNGQRYLHIAFSEDDETGIWFLEASNGQQEKIGHQTAGQPTIVIYTDDCEKLCDHLKRNKVEILEKLVSTPDSKFFHCLDLYGNRITVVELT